MVQLQELNKESSNAEQIDKLGGMLEQQHNKQQQHRIMVSMQDNLLENDILLASGMRL